MENEMEVTMETAKWGWKRQKEVFNTTVLAYGDRHDRRIAGGDDSRVRVSGGRALEAVPK